MTIASQRPIATCRSRTGTSSATMASPTGKMPPVAMPTTMRAASSMEKLVAMAQTNDATIITTRQMIISLSLPIMSATAPRIGWTSAKGSAKAVESSATFSGLSVSACAIGGMIGSTARADNAVANPIRLIWISTREAEDVPC